MEPSADRERHTDDELPDELPDFDGVDFSEVKIEDDSMVNLGMLSFYEGALYPRRARD